MAKRFPLPTVTRRQFSLWFAVLVLVLGAAYLVWFRIPCCGPAPTAPSEPALQTFHNACMQQARHANGGGDLVMDEATETKIGAYCGCIADAIRGNVPAEEIAKLANDSESPATRQLLERIITGCRPQLQ